MLIAIHKIEDKCLHGLNSVHVEVVRDGDYDDIDFLVQDDVGDTLETILVFDARMRLTDVARIKE